MAPDPMEKLKAFAAYFRSKIDDILVPDAGRTAALSYSMIATYALILLQVVPEILYAYFGIDYDPFLFYLLVLAASFAVVIGRLLKQPKANAWRRRFIIAVLVLIVMAVASAISSQAQASAPVTPSTDQSEVGAPYPDADFYALAVPKIRRWEGNELVPYLDTIAKPPVVTACSGSTRVAGRPITLGRVFTQEHCDWLLSYDIRRHRIGLWRLLNDTGKSGMTLTRDVSLTSWVFNIGVTLASKSTAIRRLNRGDVKGACKATGWYNRAGGRIIRGLVLRREDEVRDCLVGLV